MLFESRWALFNGLGHWSAGRSTSTHPSILHVTAQGDQLQGSRHMAPRSAQARHHVQNKGVAAVQKTPFSAAASVQSMPEVEAVQPNTTTHSLCIGPWEQLLSIIGDAAMLHLLLHTTLWQALPNGCYLQLTGPPVSKVASRAHSQVEVRSARALACLR